MTLAAVASMRDAFEKLRRGDKNLVPRLPAGSRRREGDIHQTGFASALSLATLANTLSEGADYDTRSSHKGRALGNCCDVSYTDRLSKGNCREYGQLFGELNSMSGDHFLQRHSKDLPATSSREYGAVTYYNEKMRKYVDRYEKAKAMARSNLEEMRQCLDDALAIDHEMAIFIAHAIEGSLRHELPYSGEFQRERVDLLNHMKAVCRRAPSL